jgi:hypothetical protein
MVGARRRPKGSIGIAPGSHDQRKYYHPPHQTVLKCQPYDDYFLKEPHTMNMLNRLNTRTVPLVAQDDEAPEDEGVRAKRRAKAFADLAKHQKDTEAQRLAILADIEKAEAFLRPFDQARTAIRRGQEKLRELQYSSQRPHDELTRTIRDAAPSAVQHIIKKALQLIRDMTSATAFDVDDMAKRQDRIKSLHALRKDAEAALEKPISADELAGIEARAREVFFS